MTRYVETGTAAAASAVSRVTDRIQRRRPADQRSRSASAAAAYRSTWLITKPRKKRGSSRRWVCAASSWEDRSYTESARPGRAASDSSGVPIIFAGGGMPTEDSSVAVRSGRIAMSLRRVESEPR